MTQYTWQIAVYDASQDMKRKETPYWRWGCLPQSERDAMDRHLVETKHPLAFEPGTQERRFYALAHEANAA